MSFYEVLDAQCWDKLFTWLFAVHVARELSASCEHRVTFPFTCEFLGLHMIDWLKTLFQSTNLLPTFPAFHRPDSLFMFLLGGVEAGASGAVL